MLKRPIFFQISLGILALVCIGLSVIITQKLVTSTTDQNLFFHPISRVLFSRELEVKPGLKIQKGDFLLRIDETPIATMADAEPVLSQERESEQQVSIEVADAISGVRRTVPIPVSMLDLSLTPIPSVARVTYVQKDGASDRAGMEVGDLIVSINGKEFKDIFEADMLMRQVKAGEVAQYKILRRLEPIVLNIQLANFGVPFGVIVNIIGGLLFLIPGFLIGMIRPRVRPARALSVAFVILGGFVSLLILDFSGFDGNTRPFVFWTRTVLVLFGVTSLIHARWFFPSERLYLTSKKWVLSVPWIVCVLTILLNLVPFEGRINQFIVPGGIVLILCFTVVIRFIYRSEKTIRDRKIGFFIRILDWCLVLFLIVSIPYPRLNIVVNTLVFMIPVVYGFSIFYFHIFGIDIRLNRNIQYMVLQSAHLVIVLIVAVTIFWNLVNLNLNLPQVYITGNSIEFVENGTGQISKLYFERALIILFAILGVGILRWYFRRVQNFLKRKFHRKGYDYKTAAQQLTDALFNRFNLTSLTKSLAGKLSDLMEVKSAGVLVYADEGPVLGEKGMFRSTNPISDEELKGLRHFLRTFHGTFSVDYLDLDLKKQLYRMGIQYLTPIRSQNEPLGCLLIGNKRSESCLDAEDFNFLKAASAQSAMAIENALLYHQLASQERLKHELEIARSVQLGSLPQQTPVLPHFDIAADSLPALEVGGDYFDFLDVTSHSIHFILADVSGKGTSAAFYMSKIQGIFRALAFNGLSPRLLLLRANPIIFNSMEKKSFVTAIALELEAENQTARLARAGHIGLYHFSFSSQTTVIHQPPGLALGVCNSVLFEDTLAEQDIPYHYGDVFVLISDGLSEAVNARREAFGEERIGDLISKHHSLSSGEIKAHILQEVQDFAGPTPQHDDQTLVVVKITEPDF